MGFKLTKRPPKASFRMRSLEAQVKKDFKPVTKQHIVLRRKVIKGWSSEKKPKFKTEPPKSNNNIISFKIRVEGEKPPGIKKDITYWRLLNDGTDVRHVLLLPKPYKRKTKPGILGSFPGNKNVQRIVNKKFDFPGIDARKWDETANKFMVKITNKIVIESYRNGFKRLEG